MLHTYFSWTSCNGLHRTQNLELRSDSTTGQIHRLLYAVYRAANENPWQLARKLCMSQLHIQSFANVNRFYKQFPICHCQSRSFVSVIYATRKNVYMIKHATQSSLYQTLIFAQRSAYNYRHCSDAKLLEMLRYSTWPPWRNIQRDNYPIQSSICVFSFQQYRQLRFPILPQLSCYKLLTFTKCSLKALQARLWSISNQNFTSGFNISSHVTLKLTPDRQQSFSRRCKFPC